MCSHVPFPSRTTTLVPSWPFIKRETVAWLGFIVCLAVSLPLSAWGQLTVLPTAGKYLGSATAPEPGKWIVFASGFMPIQPKLVDAGKTIFWEGEAGDYAVIFLPPGDAQPIVQKVTLGVVGPVPPPVPPGERWAVIWEESSQRTPQQAALYVALRKTWAKNRLFILDVSSLPESWERWRKQVPANQPTPALMVCAADKLVRVVALPSSVDAVKTEVAR